MTKLSRATEYTTTANTLDTILGAPPILPGEDAEAYDTMKREFREAVQPRNIIEETLVRDAVDITWEIQRLKKYKAKLLYLQRHEALTKLFDKHLGFRHGKGSVVDAWTRGEKKAVKEVEEFLANHGLEVADLEPHGFVAFMENHERIDRLIMQAEARRSAHLREIDRHRSSLAEAVRDKIKEDEEHVAIEHQPPDEDA